MLLSKAFEKVDSKLRELILENLRSAGISANKTIAIGVPNLERYVDGNIIFNDANYIAITPFIVLQPLDLDPNITDIFSLSANSFKIVENLHCLAIFSSNEGTFKFDVSNNLDSSLLEDLMNRLAIIGSGSQTYGAVAWVAELFGKIGDMNIPGLSTIANAVAGKRFSGPRIWTEGSVNTSINIRCKHDYLLEGYDHEKIKLIFDTIKLFTVPRASGYVEEKKIDQNATQLKTNADNNTKPDTTQQLTEEEVRRVDVSLSRLQYKYPYFCRVIHGNTGKVIYPIAIVTNFSSDFDIFKTSEITANQIPFISEFNFEIEPILPFRSIGDIRNTDDLPISSVESLFTNLIKENRLLSNENYRKTIYQKFSREIKDYRNSNRTNNVIPFGNVAPKKQK